MKAPSYGAGRNYPDQVISFQERIQKIALITHLHIVFLEFVVHVSKKRLKKPTVQSIANT